MEKQQYVKMTNVKINGGFWKYRQDMNANITIHAVKNRFEETGRFKAFEGTWREGLPQKPIFWWSSDIEKWIESVAYLIQNGHGKEFIPLCDHIADCIEKTQNPDGYYNMWILQFEPSKQWTNRNWHELYTAGHLIEAAIAYYEATGKLKLLNCALKMVDCIERVFVKENSAAFVTDGHPEIELALVKLYRASGEKRYLELSKFFVDKRGANDKDKPIADWCNSRYDQSHVPVREQTTAEGHAVRACYLYCGMADLAYEYEDETLFKACKNIFDNIEKKRMYITGGIGSTHRCEGFTIDYDLPNLTAYCETCASIALMMFAKRMLLLEPDSRYGDVFERVLYNSFLSSTSLSGDSFFYENPLEFDPKLTGRETFANVSSRMPITQRVAVFHTSCCPPNITRFIASLSDCIYMHNESSIYVNQFMESNAAFQIKGKDVTIRQHTNYPVDGQIYLQVDGECPDILAVRIPGWCDNWYADIDGQPAEYIMKNGYALFKLPFRELHLSFDMTPFAVEATPYIRDNAGRIAIQRGPVIYCLEAIDNGPNLRDIHIDIEKPIIVEENEIFKFPVLRATGWRRDEGRFTVPYQKYKDVRKEQELYFIPYYAMENRGETEMIVWINP